MNDKTEAKQTIEKIKEKCIELRKSGFSGDCLATVAAKLFSFVDVCVPQLLFHIAALEREGKEPCEYIQTDDDSNLWECSVCGAEWVFISGSPSENDMNYCPHCGRKLEG